MKNKIKLSVIVGILGLWSNLAFADCDIGNLKAALNTAILKLRAVASSDINPSLYKLKGDENQYLTDANNLLSSKKTIISSCPAGLLAVGINSAIDRATGKIQSLQSQPASPMRGRNIGSVSNDLESLLPDFDNLNRPMLNKTK